MKNPRRLLILILLLGSFLAGSLSCRADDDASRKAAAVELLQAMHSERAIDHIADQMSLSAGRMYQPGHTSATPAEDTAFSERLRQEARDTVKEQLNWQTLEPTFAQLYAEAFSEAELRQLIEFYKSPVGAKLLDKQPDLASKFQQITQQKVRAAVPLVTQKLRASIQKFRQEHPTASPSPAASPGSSPAPSAAAPAPPAVSPTPTPTPTPSPTPIPPAATE
jgi:hypothetical protein